MFYRIAIFMLTAFLLPYALAGQDESWFLAFSGDAYFELMYLTEQDENIQSPESRINPFRCYIVENNSVSERQMFDSNSLEQFNQVITFLLMIPQSEIAFAGIEVQPTPLLLSHEITATFPLLRSYESTTNQHLLTPGPYRLHREYLNFGTWFRLQAQGKKTLSLLFDKNKKLVSIKFGQFSLMNTSFLNSPEFIKRTGNNDDDPAGGAAGATAVGYAQMTFNQPSPVSLQRDKPLWILAKPGSPAEQLSPTGSIIDFLAELFLHTTK